MTSYLFPRIVLSAQFPALISQRSAPTSQRSSPTAISQIIKKGTISRTFIIFILFTLIFS
jgi:hypothetical protein